jgi:chitinase
MGYGIASGVTAEQANEAKAQLAAANKQTSIQNSCYWSACGDTCGVGFFATTQSKGQIGGITLSDLCTGDEYNTLCCAAGTNVGQCQWEGW